MNSGLHRALLILLGCTPVVLHAQQGVFLTAGRVFGGERDESSWHLTMQQNLIGPIGFDVSAMVLPGARPKTGDLVGFGTDLTLFQEGSGFPGVFVGVAAGLGFSGQSRVWAGGSLGLRVPVVTAGSFRMTLEGRWRNFTFDGRDGVEVGATIGWRSTRRDEIAAAEAAGLWVPRSTMETLRSRGIPEAKAKTLNDVISVAIEEMGQPYVWGGTGDGRGGFDCSGLIYYAYGKQGISIPRTSLGQSRAGVAIRREESLLLPGDILTFAERGDSVTHVGLYLGEGRFIHSASAGVSISRLTEESSEGRMWLRKWVGIRRIVE